MSSRHSMRRAPEMARTYGSQLANGEAVEVGREVVEMACCDGQHLGHVVVAANDNPGPAGPVGGVAGAPTKPVEAVSVHAHVGAPIQRAKQSIPPALRRSVMLRDQKRCRVPGCSNGTFLDVHHITPRSEGGQNELDNLLVLCGAHHRAAHRGELVLEGTFADRICFRHADGASYGRSLQPHTIEAHAKAFAALRHLGFREGDIRTVLAALRTAPAFAEATTEQLLREALRRLAVPKQRPHGGHRAAS